ncbi:MAG: sugar phosphate isomerase/epimerase [Clostridia bacterium]|nr:sugar phosphate isomerase/epimerase [Clostridia bacterium]
MRVGINLYGGFPYEQVIEAFKENGIDHTFVCIEHPQFEAVMQALQEAKIKVDSFHAPYKKQNLIWTEGDTGEEMLAIFLKSIDYCVQYGVKTMVMHVSNGRPMPEISETGVRRFDKLMSYAKGKGITVAFESHRYLENVKFMMERYPEAGFCLDTAHEHAFTPGLKYMPFWGHRLVATHISDNDCLCDKDMHMLPFDGIIDWETTAKEIAECGRDVTLMLEIKPGNHEKYKDLSAKEYYAEATKRVKKLSELVDSAR